MIVCSSKPLPVILAALLSQLTGTLPCLEEEARQLGLFSQVDIQRADTEELSQLIRRLSLEAGLDARWLPTKTGRTLMEMVAANLRYRGSERGPVIFSALEEAFRQGPSHCLLGIGPSSRSLVQRFREVCHEVHRMTGFVRFHPGPGNTLITRPKLFHDTGDWLIRQLARRYPHNRLILVLEDKAFAFENGELSLLPDKEPFLAYLSDRSFEQAWETYYRAQYIENRRNDRQAGRLIPQKYRNWLHEGAILNEVANKPPTAK